MAKSESSNYYKSLSPYETQKKQYWSEKMSQSMPLFTGFTASIATTLQSISNAKLLKSPKTIKSILEECSKLKNNLLEIDSAYYDKLLIAAAIDQVGKSGLDIDKFKDAMNEVILKARATKKPKKPKTRKATKVKAKSKN